MFGCFLPCLAKVFLMDIWVYFQLLALASEAVRTHLVTTSLSERLVAQSPRKWWNGSKGICTDFCDPPCLLLPASPKATSQHLAHIHFSSRWTRLPSGQSLAPAFGVFIYRSQNRFFLAPSVHSPGKGWVLVSFCGCDKYQATAACQGKGYFFLQVSGHSTS